MPVEKSLIVDDLRCPYCGVVIPKVFARASTPTPVANSHRVDNRGAKNCRVIVVIDPLGDRHQVHRVPEGVTDHTVMLRVMETLRAA